MDNTVIFSKLDLLPENMKAEVLDFIDFLLSKSNRNNLAVKNDHPQKSDREPGSAKGMFTMMPDFDEPLEDFKEYME